MEIKTIKDIEDIYNIIKEFDKVFNPSLSSIIENLYKYSEKISKYATTIAIIENAEVLGFASFYCNDLENKIAFLTQIAVKKHGLGSKLLKECERISKKNGMEKIRLEVYNTNKRGIQFYKKNMYVFEKKCSDKSSFMTKKL